MCSGTHTDRCSLVSNLFTFEHALYHESVSVAESAVVAYYFMYDDPLPVFVVLFQI